MNIRKHTWRNVVFTTLFIAVLLFSFLPMPFHAGQFGAGVASASTEETFYPQADGNETTSVDGSLYYIKLENKTWATVHDSTGTDCFADDSSANGASADNLNRIAGWVTAVTTGYYWALYRSDYIFDTSGLPDSAVKSSAVFSVYGTAKVSTASVHETFNVYASSPASDTALVATDYDNFSTTAFSTAKSSADWSITGYNDFTLNAAGLAAISLGNVTKLSIRGATYDAPNTSPGSAGATKEETIGGYYVDQTGTDKDPKLVVTYTCPPALTTLAATSVTPSSAILNGNITTLGCGGNATIRGFKYGLTEADTWDVHEDGNFGVEAFNLPVTELTSGTLYHVRAYATSAGGTGYGSWVTFTACIPLADDGISAIKARFPAVRYNGTYDRTYYIYLSTEDSGSIYVNYFDNSSGAIGTPEAIASSTGSADIHGSPVISVIPSGDYAGYILAASADQGAAGDPLKVYRSPAAETISGNWTSNSYASEVALYPQFAHLGNGTTVIFYMYSPDSSVSFGTRYRLTSDGGQTWSAATTVLASTSDWTYPTVQANGDSVHIAYNKKGYANVYYVYSPDNLVTWRTQGNDTEITLPVSFANSETVDTGSDWVDDIQMDGDGSPVISFVAYVNSTTVLAKWAHYHDSAWSVHSTGVNALAYDPSIFWSINTGIFIDPYDTTHVYIGNRTSSSTSDIVEMCTTDGGTTWDKVTDITSGSTTRYDEPRPVVNYAPSMKLIFNAVSSYTDFDTWTSSLMGWGRSVDISSTPASSITSSSVTLNGNITSGNATQYAWSYGTSHVASPSGAPPAGYDGNYTSPEGNYTVGAYNSGGNITGLLPYTQYFYNFGVYDGSDWYWDTEGNFTTLAALPAFVTTPATSVSYETATLNGNITSIGGQALEYYAFVWHTSDLGKPTGYPPGGWSGAWESTSSSWGVGAYPHAITGLSPNQQYFFYIGGNNSAGWNWSDTSGNFTTLALSTPTVATLAATAISDVGGTMNGNLTATNGQNADLLGFLWGNETGNYNLGNWTQGTLTNYQYAAGTTFNHAISELSPGETIFYKAQGHNSAGWATDDEGNFTTAVSLPTVHADATGSITSTSATLYGEITNTGGENADFYGWVYGDDSLGDPGNVTPPAGYDGNWTSGSGDYGVDSYDSDSHITGLTPAHKYYLRFMAHNSMGWEYSDTQLDFTTLAATPTVQTNAADAISYTTVTLHGNILSTGGISCTIRGFRYGLSTGNYTGNWTENGSFNAGAFDSASYITGLVVNTRYYFEAMAYQPEGGWGYGSELYFDTLNYSAPTVLNLAAADITYNSATLGGNITSVDGANVTAASVLYGLSAGNYSFESFAVGGPWGVTTYTCSANSLSGNTTYFFKAKVTNLGGTGYATAEGNFTTSAPAFYIIGTVREVNGDVLGNATVTVDESNGVETDEYGNYTQFTDTGGSHSVEANKADFREETQTISVDGNETLNFQDHPCADSQQPGTRLCSHLRESVALSYG